MNWIITDVLIQAAKILAEIHQTDFFIRDEGLLESAVNRPLNTFYYNSDSDICDLAAEYAFGLIKNHPFFDGNKRLAYVACRLFLLINSMDIKSSQINKYKKIIALAENKITQKEFALWLKANTMEKF